MDVGTIVNFKGIKSRGISWKSLMKLKQFQNQTKDSMYGKIFAIQGKEIWLHIYSKENILLDKPTWGFMKNGRCNNFYGNSRNRKNNIL